MKDDLPMVRDRVGIRSMLKTLKTIYRPALGGLLASLLLAGCGGSGPSAAATVDFTGSVTGRSYDNTSSISSVTTPTPRVFGTDTAVVPANMTVPVGKVAIVTTDTPLLNTTGSSGLITVNGNETGLSLVNGYLSGNLAVPASTSAYEINIGSGSRSRTDDSITLGTIEKNLKISDYLMLSSYTSSNGKLILPTLFGTLPTNGGSLSSGYVIADFTAYPDDMTGWNARLVITWVAGGQTVTVSKTVDIPSNKRPTFTSLSTQSIPSTGVESVSLFVQKSG